MTVGDGLRRGWTRWAMIGAGAVAVAATIGLWARHGAAVFFDMVAAGFAYCF
ncbi:hypothetical protein FHS55_000257 [Angulomicrobium tetraedrale]|uniref:Uncharacterized protein n=1 Tax=Ancylobacter tetraedralis TaxID=217068 RepID=A0A839Z436_9HYPH|nr:hypothetical protein [Ancylobacter tetraedralis]MBB3769671.1 hypothetical protein [Ancylobacter tetraedralis]